jgi:hypothetical protein
MRNLKAAFGFYSYVPDSSASFLKYRTPTNPANAPAAPTDRARVRRESARCPLRRRRWAHLGDDPRRGRGPRLRLRLRAGREPPGEEGTEGPEGHCLSRSLHSSAALNSPSTPSAAAAASGFRILNEAAADVGPWGSSAYESDGLKLASSRAELT